MPWPSWPGSSICAPLPVFTGLKPSSCAISTSWSPSGPHFPLFRRPGQVLPQNAGRGTAHHLGDGEQSRDFTYIDNVVHANLLAAAAPAEKVSGQMMNIATNSRITLNQTFEILCDLTGYRGKPAYDAPRAGDIRDSLADIAWPENCSATSRKLTSARACAAPSSGTRPARHKSKAGAAAPAFSTMSSLQPQILLTDCLRWGKLSGISFAVSFRSELQA